MWFRLPENTHRNARALQIAGQHKFLLGGGIQGTDLPDQTLTLVDTAVKTFLLQVDEIRMGQGEGSLLGYVHQAPAASMELALRWERQAAEELALDDRGSDCEESDGDDS